MAILARVGLLLAGVTAALLTACGGEVTANSGPVLSAYSGPTGSTGSMPPNSAGESAIHFGSASGTTTGSLSVRPDLVEVPFQISATGGEDISMLQKEVGALAQRVGAAANRPVVVRLRALTIPTVTAEGQHRAVTEGCFEIALTSDLDFWARARLLEAIVSIRHAGNDGSAAKSKSDLPKLSTILGAPLLRVKDPEAYRSALTRKWVDESRVLASEVEPRGKLALSDCAPPGLVQQHAVGPDEIVLSLPITCKLAAGAKGEEPAR